MNKLQQKFFSDPDWEEVVKLLMGRVDELKNFDTIDTNQSAETVKAEIIGRRLAYNALIEFIQDTKIGGKRIISNQNTFK